VLVDFTATWCGPCKALAPVVERVASENAGRVKVVTVDTDASPEAARRYGIRGVPTLLVFRNGEKTAGHVGLATKEKVLALLARGGADDQSPRGLSGPGVTAARHPELGRP
jgi:thioredoxin 1